MTTPKRLSSAVNHVLAADGFKAPPPHISRVHSENKKSAIEVGQKWKKQKYKMQSCSSYKHFFYLVTVLNSLVFIQDLVFLQIDNTGIYFSMFLLRLQCVL